MPKQKIKSLKDLKVIVAGLKRQGKKVAFTNGCFDILHLGHVRYLEQAKKRADVLIVGLNSDKSVRKIKGPKRPLNPQNARAQVLSALRCVDYIVIFHSPTPIKLIKTLKPDLLLKGADWQRSEIVGKEIVEEYGGRVARIALTKGYSTTKIIKKIGLPR
jgi:D-beta-D-heptose 7-phosphate kinase/D-beta-D-heptose 1-phosphate adenosyltransferase